MFQKVKALIDLPSVLQKGKMVSNPEAWKKGQVTAGVLAGLMGSAITIARAFGYDLPLTDDQLLTIGSAVVAVTGLFWTPAVTLATSEKVGLQSKTPH